MTFANALQFGAVTAMTVATVFIGVVGVKSYDLSENYGRLDGRVARIETTLSKQADDISLIKGNVDSGFKDIAKGLERIDMRLGSVELDPKVLLNAYQMPFDKDLEPVFFKGHIYAVAKTDDARARLTAAGYKEEILGGFLPAYLLRKDFLKSLRGQ